jgi:hypothetical protein
LFREFVVGLEARRDQHDRDMSIAWHVAALSRQKKLPELKRLLTKRKERPPSLEQQRGVLHVLSAQYGLPLVTRKKKRGAEKIG